jgi:hypothetical protein
MPELPSRSTWRELKPGVYDDGASGVHIDAVEVCAHFGVEPSDANVDVVVEGAREALAELYGARAPAIELVPRG